jgi:hypothetical protein
MSISIKCHGLVRRDVGADLNSAGVGAVQRQAWRPAFLVFLRLWLLRTTIVIAGG